MHEQIRSNIHALRDTNTSGHCQSTGCGGSCFGRAVHLHLASGVPSQSSTRSIADCSERAPIHSKEKRTVHVGRVNKPVRLILVDTEIQVLVIQESGVLVLSDAIENGRAVNVNVSAHPNTSSDDERARACGGCRRSLIDSDMGSLNCKNRILRIERSELEGRPLSSRARGIARLQVVGTIRHRQQAEVSNRRSNAVRRSDIQVSTEVSVFRNSQASRGLDSTGSYRRRLSGVVRNHITDS